MLRYLSAVAVAASGLLAQGWQISLPAKVSTGDLVTLRLTLDGAPQAGVALRVTAPAREIATVKPLRLVLGDGRTTLFRDDVVLVPSADGNECRVVLLSGQAGVAPCDGLERRAFGQPLGLSDPDGRVLSRDLAAVAGRIELAAERNGSTVATATVDVQPYQNDETVPVSPGITLRSRRWMANGEGPFAMQTVEVDPRYPQTFLLPVRGADRAIGVEPVSNLSRRYGALVAMNGAAFQREGKYAGAAQGPYVWNGRLVGAGSAAALVRCTDGRLLVADGLTLTARAVGSDGQSLELNGINRARGENEAILYTPLLGDRTLTGDDGAEAQLDLQDRVNELRDGAGNSTIPFDGRVISGQGAAADFLRQRATAGTLLRVEAPLPPAACAYSDLIPAAVTNPEERRPRSAFALTERGTWLLATADGAQASTPGMRQDELEQELRAAGATQILPLGDSATLTLNDALRSQPGGGQEPDSGDALLIFQINELPDLLKVVDRIGFEPGQISGSGIDALNAPLDQAVAAFLDGDPGGVRQAILNLRDTIQKLDGVEIAPAAARVMLRATEAFITTLPDVQPLRRYRVVR